VGVGSDIRILVRVGRGLTLRCYYVGRGEIQPGSIQGNKIKAEAKPEKNRSPKAKPASRSIAILSPV
jgi:hypothetical protein